MGDSLHERADAIENIFFAKRDQELLNKLRAEMDSAEVKESLSSALGIDDPDVLDGLLEHQITPQTMLVVGIIPLVFVAWSDGVLEGGEKSAVLQAADIAGVKQGTAAFEILESWLDQPPESELLDSWKAYIGAFKTTVDPASMVEVKTRLLDRAEKVASAAGGFLGLGNKISDSEQRVLDDLAETFV